MSSKLALGYRHLGGYGVPKSCDIAAKYYKSAAEHIVTQTNVGLGALEMISLTDRERRDMPMEETDNVIRYFKDRAELQNDPDAQVALGYCFFFLIFLYVCVCICITFFVFVCIICGALYFFSLFLLFFFINKFAKKKTPKNRTIILPWFTWISKGSL